MNTSTIPALLGGLLLSLSVHAADVVKIGSTPGVTSDSVLAAAAEARAQGIEVKLVEFTDWTLPNEALNNGDIDLNYFQHQAFLDNAIKQRGYHLQNIGFGILQNIGLYSNKIQRLEDLPRKARVGVASDVVNQGRGLLLLQKAGLIKLRTGTKEGASVRDISENSKELQFSEIEGPQLLRSLDDLDLAVLWPSHFTNAGRPEQAGKALLFSGVTDTYYAMRFTAHQKNASNPVLQKFVKIYQNSPKVREVIAKQYSNDARLYALPWLSAPQEAAKP